MTLTLCPQSLPTPRPTPLEQHPACEGSGWRTPVQGHFGPHWHWHRWSDDHAAGCHCVTDQRRSRRSFVHPWTEAVTMPVFDVTLSYVTTSLSDSVSWQAEYQGQGFEDIRSLSNTALLYSTMLLDERLMIYGRGTTGNGDAGALAAPAFRSQVSPHRCLPLALPASRLVRRGSLSPLTRVTFLAPPAPPCTKSSDHGCIGCADCRSGHSGFGLTDSPGALGYNLFVGSVSAGPFYYAGRTGNATGYITSQPTSALSPRRGRLTIRCCNQLRWSSDQRRCFWWLRQSSERGTVGANPGAEFQNAFGSLYESVKADPEEIWLNGFDRLQLSNAIVNNSSNSSAYRVFVPNSEWAA